MNNVDKVSKDVKNIVESIKDLSSANLLNAVRSNSVQLDELQLSRIIAVVNMSLDEGFQRALPSFQNSVKKYVKAK
jgi:hypothetical protein